MNTNKITILISFLLILFSVNIFARGSASHTVTIRIIRSNAFAIHQPVTNPEANAINQESEENQSKFNLDWSTSDKSKKITVVTDTDDDHPISLISNHQNHNSSTKIQLTNSPVDIMNGISTTKGVYEFQYVNQSQNTQNTRQLNPTVTYTLTDT